MGEALEKSDTGSYQRLHTWLHHRVTGSRRVRILAEQIASLLPENATLLDVGAGSGEVASIVMSAKPGISITGVDVFVRPDTAIPVMHYDGLHFPTADKSFDYVCFVDVLHHTPDPVVLLKEAVRVARKGVILKDHNCNNVYTERLLHFTDWFGNRSYGVHLEYNFLSRLEWQQAFRRVGLYERVYRTQFGLYPKFTRVVFPESLDFFALLDVKG